jgi:hypothetical protein
VLCLLENANDAFVWGSTTHHFERLPILKLKVLENINLIPSETVHVTCISTASACLQRIINVTAMYYVN